MKAVLDVRLSIKHLGDGFSYIHLSNVSLTQWKPISHAFLAVFGYTFNGIP